MALNDESPMPIGKMYAGMPMTDVPADYLIWLHDEISKMAPNKRSFSQKIVLEYAQENMEVLKQEIKDQKHKN
jgi:uncharacterized protein (DUF3820 family)